MNERKLAEQSPVIPQSGDPNKPDTADRGNDQSGTVYESAEEQKRFGSRKDNPERFEEAETKLQESEQTRSEMVSQKEISPISQDQEQEAQPVNEPDPNEKPSAKKRSHKSDKED